ncbi:ribose-phosphate pyrophosphokinase [Metapseudomonas lalkuanensis]|uniref:Ribose-phosphate pyrophosphokinase n=1 Tax=Metapseudomonas lalkuanensis TaxID=2604832 RepID=A0A5J6QMX0_9GAMM|nr:ribose-phosphate diphosphokinase [Pseudomonas lalkuanensis]QEY63135.1 ribose-phosphate pyrophosphokinase [Pseudomonas lalkuanensis]
MADEAPLLLALHESHAFATRVARHLALPLGALAEHRYEDGEYKCRPLDPVSGRNVVVFSGLYPEPGLSVHDKLCRMLFLCAAIKDAGARHLQVVCPYLCYTRKERRTQAQDPVITRYIATMMEASRIDSLMTMDVHDQAAFDNAFRIPTQHLESAPIFAEQVIRWRQGESIVVTSPDLGGIKRAERFRQILEGRIGHWIGHACVEKYRRDEALSGGMLIGKVEGCTVILFDDLISTGTTLLRAAEACHAGGAREIYAMATHGLFTASNILLESPLLKKVVISDSVPPPTLESSLKTGHFEVLDISESIALALATQYGLGGQRDAAI